MRVCVIDGQGGGLGRRLVEGLCGITEGRHELLAMGTNRVAADAMARAGAEHIVVGASAIVRSVRDADVILGSLSLLLAGAWLGEVTPDLARAVLQTPARKLLLPVNRSRVEVICAAPSRLEQVFEQAIKRVQSILDEAVPV